MDLSIYIGNKIRHYRNLNKWTQTELGERIEVGKGTISHYENGIRTPDHEKLFKLAEVFQVSIDKLFPPREYKGITFIYEQLEPYRHTKVYNFAEAKFAEQNKVASLEETKTVYLNSKLSAGTGILDLDPENRKEVEYSDYVPKHDLAFMVSGNSMEPAFADGEIVFVEKTPDIHNGQFIAVQVNEEAYIKKAYLEDERFRLVSLNGDYKDIYTCGDDDIRVIGRVIL